MENWCIHFYIDKILFESFISDLWYNDFWICIWPIILFNIFDVTELFILFLLLKSEIRKQNYRKIISFLFSLGIFMFIFSLFNHKWKLNLKTSSKILGRNIKNNDYTDYIWFQLKTIFETCCRYKTVISYCFIDSILLKWNKSLMNFSSNHFLFWIVLY